MLGVGTEFWVEEAPETKHRLPCSEPNFPEYPMDLAKAIGSHHDPSNRDGNARAGRRSASHNNKGWLSPGVVAAATWLKHPSEVISWYCRSSASQH